MAVTAVRLPHPVTLEGRTVREVAPGATARELVAGWGDVVAAVDGRPVGPDDLDRPLPDGAVLVARSLAAGGDDSNPIRAVLQIALIVAGFYVAGTSWFGGLSTFWKAATSAAIVVGGTLVINAIAPPVLPSFDGGAAGRADPVYSLVGGANRARPYEPLPLVLGSHRMFPDLGAREYTVFGSAVPDSEVTITVPTGFLPWRRRQPRRDAAGGSTDQFLHQIFHFGLGDLDVEDLRIGDTPLTDFDDVETQWPDADGALTLVAGNVDTEAGAELDDTDWVSRDTAAGAVRVELDFTAQLFELREDGSSQNRTVVLDLELTPPPDGDGNPRDPHTSAVTLRHGGPSPYRLTVSRDLSATPGVWRVRVRRRTAPTTDAQRETAGRNGDPVAYDDVAWTAVRSFQPDGADYAGQTRLALRIRASGQLSGRLDRLSAMVHQKVPVWDPDADGGAGAWTTPRRSSNPAWIFRWYARGVRIGTGLAAGVGLAAARIDDDALKEWGVWCDLHALTCNTVLYHDMTYAEALAAIAQTGRASPTWATGRLGVVYDRENQAATAYFGPGNIVAGSFEVDWASGAVADEIVCRYVDPDLDWQWNTVRRNVPGVSAADRTATLTLWGVTDRDQAAKACNLQAARQLYHKRRLRFRTGEEGRAVKRGAVAHVSHALVDGGTTGRVLGGGTRNVRLDRELALAAGDMMLFRMPNGTLHQTAVTRPAALDDDQVRLGDVLPEAPGTGTSSALDILWRHYAASSPPLRVKVVAVEPRSETEVQIEAIDEVPAYYAAATSDLTVDLPALHRAWPAVTGIRVGERLVKAGDFDVVEIVATLAVEGDWRGGTVTASLDGGPARTVAQLGPGELEARWVEPPEGTLTIRAVPGSAAAPAGRAHEVVHVIQGPQFPVARRPGRPAVSTVFDTALIGGSSPADENAEVRALAGAAAVDPLTAANAETVTSIEIGISADDDPVDAATALRREFLPQVAAGEVLMLYEAAGDNWAAYLSTTVPASIAAGARTVTVGVSHLEHGDGADVSGACKLGFSRAIRGDDGLSRYELTIYRKRVRRTANALAVPASASWDHDGTPEADNQGLEGRLTNIGDWSRVFPAYDPKTEEVMCSQATGRSDDTIPGGWSTPRRCESPAGINTVYKRSATRPAALPAGPVRVPAGTADSPPSGAGDLWQNTGVQNAFTRNWTWDGWRRAEGLPGAVELAVYQKRTKGAADPDLPDNDAQTDPPTWDYDGTPEIADKGLVGRLTNVGDWSRVFPAYDAQTEEVVCSIASGFSSDVLGGWSPVRVCENPADINKVYRRADSRPAALADGADRVPSGTHDSLDDVPAGRGYLYENTGHRNALSNTWKWDGWTRLDVVDGFPAAQKNYMMTNFVHGSVGAFGDFSVRARHPVNGNVFSYVAVNTVVWSTLVSIDVGIGANEALRTYLRTLEPDDWLIVVSDQTGRVGAEPNATAYARVTAAPTIADDADYARIALSPARAHPVFYLDSDDDGQGNGFSPLPVCLGFSRIDTASLDTEDTDITAALPATVWATSAAEPAAIAAFATPANRALADSDLPAGVGLKPPPVADHPLWAARLTGAVSGDDVTWTSGGWGKVFDPDDFGVTVNDADFTVAP